jgi:hypothetical protein
MSCVAKRILVQGRQHSSVGFVSSKRCLDVVECGIPKNVAVRIRFILRTAVDHLFDHLSMEVVGVLRGLTGPRQERIRHSTGLHGCPWGTRGTYIS